MKITAEDFAGNRSSGITDFLEQAIFLDTWDKEKIVVKPVMAGGIIWESKIPATPGIHEIKGHQTIRLPLVSMNMQYLQYQAGK